MRIFKKYTTTLPLVFLVSASLLVSWFSWDSYQRFVIHQGQLAKQSASNAAGEITREVTSLRRAMELFAKREEKLLRGAVANPDDSEAFAQLSKQLAAYFPDYYSFTIANGAGVPQLKHSDFLLTKSCRRDLSHFARNFNAPSLYVHNFDTPNSLHFDLMTRLEDQAGSSPPSFVPFFVSFKMATLARFLKSAAISGHQLLLVEYSAQTGIEKTYAINATANNADINLRRLKQGFEPQSVTAQTKVKASNWRVVNVPEAGLFSSARNNLVAKALALIALFGIVALVMWWLLKREILQLASTGKVISGIENDRHRIAMDMHDQVLSDLTYLSRQCDHMHQSVDDPKSMLKHLKTSELALDNVSNSIRSIIDDLHPQTLEILGLEASLKTYLNKSFSGLPSPQITFEAKPFADRDLSDEQRLNLYRITLEIIHNIVRHAKATQCKISLGMKNRSLVLSIEDDGVIFRPGSSADGKARGLSNINTRSAMIGSSVDWGSPSTFSDGTRFELVLPLGSKR